MDLDAFDLSYIDQQIAKRKRALNAADPSPYVAKKKSAKHLRKKKRGLLKTSASAPSMTVLRDDATLPSIWARPGTPVDIQSLSKPSTPAIESGATEGQASMFDPEIIEEKLLSLPFLDKTEFIALQLKKRGIEIEDDGPQPETSKKLSKAEKEAKLEAERKEKEELVAEERRKRKVLGPA